MIFSAFFSFVDVHMNGLPEVLFNKVLRKYRPLPCFFAVAVSTGYLHLSEVHGHCAFSTHHRLMCSANIFIPRNPLLYGGNRALFPRFLLLRWSVRACSVLLMPWASLSPFAGCCIL